MKTSRFSMLCAVALTGSLAACNPNIHDNTINISADLDFTTSIDVNAVKPGQAVPCTAKVTNVYLVDPATTPPAEHVADAGHLRYYLDDDTAAPLLITAQLTADVKSPSRPKRAITRSSGASTNTTARPRTSCSS